MEEELKKGEEMVGDIDKDQDAKVATGGVAFDVTLDDKPFNTTTTKGGTVSTGPAKKKTRNTTRQSEASQPDDAIRHSRNEIFHQFNYEVSTNDMKRYLGTMKKLLQEKDINISPEAKQGVTAITQGHEQHDRRICDIEKWRKEIDRIIRASQNSTLNGNECKDVSH
ncbi:hypothetical protein MAR_011434 [Mya arenaria]|uniref:Uncharacterized protein n=1 Tax=Mya arenaria TaxID=6604 RepID=A0ABY7FU61_MYAAR|nr:hypothetical protein MAR_011434 [Mya arenaria]